LQASNPTYSSGREIYTSGSRHFRFIPTEYKGTNNLVSYVDKEAEKAIIKGLSGILPNAGFIGEEGTSEFHSETTNWIIDPLDGTTNFIHKLPPFAISIGLLHKGELLVGVVHELNLDECFYAWKGGGAYCMINLSNICCSGD
jgi:myo-inositol-1(or 4)-monophosphatase